MIELGGSFGEVLDQQVADGLILLSCDFIETITLTGQRQYILAAIEHSTRQVRILGTTAHPTAEWAAQAARNVVMDLEDAGTPSSI